MSQKVEQVATAIRHILISGGTIDSAAIASIEAMRDPTDAMIKAGSDFEYYGETISDFQAERIYQAMIDAALK